MKPLCLCGLSCQLAILTNEDFRKLRILQRSITLWLLGPIPPKTKGSKKKKANTDAIPKRSNSTAQSLTELKNLKIVIKRSRQETHSSHASGSGADEGTGVTPGVPDAPDYDSDDDISWKSSDDDQDDEQDQDDDDAEKHEVHETTQEEEDDDEHDEILTESENVIRLIVTMSWKERRLQGRSQMFDDTQCDTNPVNHAWSTTGVRICIPMESHSWRPSFTRPTTPHPMSFNQQLTIMDTGTIQLLARKSPNFASGFGSLFIDASAMVTLDDVRTVLNDRLKGIRMEYLPETFWSQRDKANARAMIQAICQEAKRHGG
ncbi:hypothetical protein Tco_0777209 [Tanacetum coccineum]